MVETTQRRLGRSGLAVSAVGLGCNNLGRPGTATHSDADATRVVHAAVDAGITLFDVADIYGSPPGRSEELLGAALGSRRPNVVVATKFGMDAGGANGPDWAARGSRRYIRTAVQRSLRRLGTDWIDLYQFHQPDPLTPLDETLAALDDLVTAGTVRYIGLSNFPGWRIADAAWIARDRRLTPIVSTQNAYSVLDRDIEREIGPAAAAFGLGLLPFYPLANGLLTGKYSGAAAPPGSRLRELKPHLLDSAPWDALERLESFAAARSLGLLDVAIGWLLAQPIVASVIAGATSAEQVVANAAASTRYRPDLADLDEIDAIVPPPV